MRLESKSKFFAIYEDESLEKCIGKYQKKNKTITDKGKTSNLPDTATIVDLESQNGLNNISVDQWWNEQL